MTSVEIKPKVLVYITRQHPDQPHQNQLLILIHPFEPEAGIQVPGGSLHEHESPEAGALREAWEETGLTGLRIAAKLGETQRDMRDYGLRLIYHRHFFHLTCDYPTPEIWRHNEEDPSDALPGSHPEPIVFEFQWVSLPDAVPPLTAGHDALLPELLHHLQIKP